MKMLLGILFLVAAGEAALLVTKECLYGPSFWCKTYTNAKLCGTIDHCNNYVWEKNNLSKDTDDCQECLSLAEGVRDQFTSREFKVILTTVVEIGCSFTPFTYHECLNYMQNDLVPAAIAYLRNEWDPRKVCILTGLCKNKNIQEKRTMMNSLKDRKRNRSFKKCFQYLNDFRSYMQSAPKHEVQSEMKELCSKLNPHSIECNQLMKANFHKIYNFIIKADFGQLCELIGKNKTPAVKFDTLLRKSGDVVCDFCETIVLEWKNTLGENTTEAEFKAFLDAFCDEMGSFGKECHSLVDQYYKTIYQLLVDEVDPIRICKEIGLCDIHTSIMNTLLSQFYTKTPEKYFPKVESIANQWVKADVVEYGAEHDHIMSNDIEVSQPIKKLASTECMICEFIAGFLRKFLQGPKSESEIKAAMDTLCRTLPHTFSETCEDYVAAYGEEIIQMIILEIEPSVICPELHMCPTRINIHLKDQRSFGCALCVYIKNDINLSLRFGKTFFENYLKTLCTVISNNEKECAIFVEYSLRALKELENFLEEDYICQSMGFCPFNNVPNRT